MMPVGAPQIPTLTIGGRVYTDLTNLIYLIGYMNDATNKFCSPRLQNGSSGYSVPAAKTLTLSSLAVTNNIASSGSASRSFIIGYCDNDLGINSTTTPTNPVYLGRSVTITYGVSGGGANPQPTGNQYNLTFTVPTGKFLFVQQNSASALQSTVEFYGYTA